MMRYAQRRLKSRTLFRALPASAGGAVCLIVGLSPAQAQPTWTLVRENAEFSPRDTSEGVVFNGKMWLSNGYYHGNVLTRDLWNSRDGKTWSRVLEDTPYDGYSEMVVFKDRLWAVKESVWSSTDGVVWDRVCERTPFGSRGYGEVVVYRDRMWQLGSGPDVWSSTDGAQWALEVEVAPFGARSAAAVAVHAGKIWILGGRIDKPNSPPEKGYPNFTTLSDVWCSEDGIRWDCVLEKSPWSPRMWFPAVTYEDRLWIVGGYDNVNHTNLGDIWSTVDGPNWDEFPGPTPFSPRHEPTCYLFESGFWLVAGNSWPVLNDVWRLSSP